MDLKNHRKKTFAIYVFSALVIALIILVVSIILKNSHPTPPEIGLLEIKVNSLVIHPSKKYLASAETEQLLYCLSLEDNPATCKWQDSAEFPIEYDTTYYTYIKSLDTDLISQPKTINYPNPDSITL